MCIVPQTSVNDTVVKELGFREQAVLTACEEQVKRAGLPGWKITLSLQVDKHQASY